MTSRLLGAMLLACLVASPVHARSVIDAIIHVESKGRAHVTGRSGEIGLMQIKCRTARSIGFRGKCRELYDPSINRKYGTAYFHLALRLAHGHIDTAISRYQRGAYSRFRGCSWYCQKVKRAMK